MALRLIAAICVLDAIFMYIPTGVQYQDAIATEANIPSKSFYEIFFLNENYGWAESFVGTIVRFRKP